MGRRNKQGMYFHGSSRPAQVDEGVQVHGYERDHPWKRKRPERIDQSPPYNLPNVDVHGLIFAVLAHLIDHLGDKTELNRAKAMGHSRAVPYLDWWALANSADIVVRRHAGCIPQASTFSTTARAWGLDVERASKRARPDFDGLV